MKRELDSVAVGRVQSPALSPCAEVLEDVGCRRFKSAKVNGYIVYSRAKKSRNSRVINGAVDARNIGEAKNKESREKQLFEGVKKESSQVVENVADGRADCGAESVLCKDEPVSEPEQSLVEEAFEEDGPLILMTKKTRKLKNKKSRRFTRSTLKLKDEPVDVAVSGFEAIESGVVMAIEVEMIAEGSALTPPKKNLEMKMSKKIALDDVPMTVKELFETGLLEGVPVVYMGGKKFQAFGLRGTIKDAGILCSCPLCKGCRVIPPSQFEIHAIKQYRRAGQYICFENGKSLLDVLNVCRASSLDSLEATIQSAIGGLPEEKTFTCRRCKGTFPSIYVGKVGPLCNTCTNSKETNGNATFENSIQASSVETISTLELSRSASMSTSSLDSTPLKIKQKSLKSDSRTKLSPNAPVRMSSRKKSQQSPKQVFSEKLSRSASLHLSPQKNKQWKTAPRKLKPSFMLKSLKSPSSGAFPQNKCQWKITTKDQRLHKLVFEEDGLPDGTEVAYYARGQKLLVGYKTGFGILCLCCNSEVSPSTFEAHAGWATRKKPYAYIYSGIRTPRISGKIINWEEEEMGNRKKLKTSSRPTEKSDLFDDLPDDLVICILRKLSSSASRPSDLVNILFTCRRMYRLCLNPLVLSEAGAKTFALKANSWSDSGHRFLKRCVNAGNTEATYTLGMIRFYCLQNRQNGASLMAKAAIKSHGSSLYSLAVIQFNGSGGSKDDKDLRAGVALCARAACLGHIDALRELGHCLQDGYGVPQNVTEGRRLLLQANARELASSFKSMLASRTSRKQYQGHAHHACLSMDNINITGCPLLSELGCNVPAREVHPANQFLRDWFLSGHGTLGQGLRLCSHSGCGRPETRPHEFRRCSVCGTVNYCSRACQALDWKLRHRLQCVQQMDQWHDGGGQHDGDDEIGDIVEIEGAEDVAVPQ